ncbi:MAG: hypothetical protein IPJ30_04685 [Acidobacteria bacterium]|nr:hypothetical protein [Acidobacteriota bacterium]
METGDSEIKPQSTTRGASFGEKLLRMCSVGALVGSAVQFAALILMQTTDPWSYFGRGSVLLFLSLLFWGASKAR